MNYSLSLKAKAELERRRRARETQPNQHPAANDLTAFKAAVWRPYRHAPHLALIDEALAQVARYVESGGVEGISRLAIFIPPRHGKSQTVARLFPAWFLGRNPDKRIILTGYGASLVEKHSRFVRNLIDSDAYAGIFSTRLAPDSQSRASWDIAGNEGGMDAVGILGSATGKGTHCLILDDPVKSRKEAESPVIRQSVWEAYTNDLRTRLEPGGAIVLIMTRWHEDDLAGRLLRGADDEDAEPWHVINLPALAEADDLLGRPDGAALWPARYDERALRKSRADIGSYAFDALYQQHPRPRDGALFKFDWIELARVAEAPRLSKIVVAIDPAASATGNETGIVVCGMAYQGGRRHGYVLADGSLHGTPLEWGRRAAALRRQYGAQRYVVETNQGGDMTVHVIKTADPAAQVTKVKAADGKAVRAEPVAALYEQCLPAGTLIATAHGQKPIEQIVVGDFVWTRAGLRRVLWAGQTGDDSTIAIQTGNSHIVATKHHPVFVVGRGFVPAWKVASGKDKVLTWDSDTLAMNAVSWLASPVASADLARLGVDGLSNGNPNANTLSWMGFGTTCNPMAIGGLAGIEEVRRCIGLYGNPPMELSLMGGTSITQTAISPTIELKTLRRYHPRPIANRTPRLWYMPTQKASSHVSDWNGGRNDSPNGVYASSAASRSNRQLLVSGFALQPVTRPIGVTHVEPAGAKVPVFNLTVQGQPEFFANGILVHNCLVHHVGEHVALEDQMIQWQPGVESPDRLDALVWGITELLVQPAGVGLR